MGVFVRRVKTGSGATAVQIVHKRGRRILSIEHVGSARTDDELALLLQVAEERRRVGQFALDLQGAGEVTRGVPGTATTGVGVVVEDTASLIPWEALAGVYADLGLERLADDTFRALVLARVIEPTSKADTVRVLSEIGVVSPRRVTFMRCLKRVIERDYRAVVAQACHRHGTRGGPLAVVLCDVTTLHFEVAREDRVCSSFGVTGLMGGPVCLPGRSDDDRDDPGPDRPGTNDRQDPQQAWRGRTGGDPRDGEVGHGSWSGVDRAGWLVEDHDEDGAGDRAR